MKRIIEYASEVRWTGNTGSGTSTYDSYSREYVVQIDGKADLIGTSDKAFRGDPALHDPEDHFLAAIAGCHMLSYLALASLRGVVVTAYSDAASGVMEVERGSGLFTSVTLRPTVTIAAGSDRDLALALHDTAHAQCFIANSCSVPIHHQPTILVAGA
jgi:organic hydroperoxide reductase OsmC/OhrA